MNYMEFSKQLAAAEAHLAKVDARLDFIIAKYGHCTIVPHTNYYEELISSIISQQLSIKAASTIWKRFIALYDNKTPTPEQIIATDVETIRGVGASYAKSKLHKRFGPAYSGRQVRPCPHSNTRQWNGHRTANSCERYWRMERAHVYDILPR